MDHNEYNLKVRHYTIEYEWTLSSYTNVQTCTFSKQQNTKYLVVKFAVKTLQRSKYVVIYDKSLINFIKK